MISCPPSFLFKKLCWFVAVFFIQNNKNRTPGTPTRNKNKVIRYGKTKGRMDDSSSSPSCSRTTPPEWKTTTTPPFFKERREDDRTSSLKRVLREDHLRCMICMDVVGCPMICVNSHTVCASCLLTMQENGNMDCPACRLKTHWTLNRGMLQLARHMGMKVDCGNEGCSSSLCIDKLDEHRHSCPHRLFPCPLHQDDPEEMYTLPNLIAHLSLYRRQVVFLRSDEWLVVHSASELTERVVVVDRSVVVLVHIHPSYQQRIVSPIGPRSEFVLRVGGIGCGPRSEWTLHCLEKEETASQTMTSRLFPHSGQKLLPFVSRFRSDLCVKMTERPSLSSHEVFSSPPTPQDVKQSAEKWAEVCSRLPTFYRSDDVQDAVSLTFRFFQTKRGGGGEEC